MGGKLPVVSGKQAVRALERAGFVVARVSGSHHLLVHPRDTSRTPLPLREGAIR